MDTLKKTWTDVIDDLKNQFPYRKAMTFYDQQVISGKQVAPARHNLLNAFKFTPFEDLKVVILGQDPYINPNQAMGLSFSVPPGEKVPPSLVNIYKELQSDIEGFQIPNHGCLIPWATQGVLLLNSILSVELGKSLSHKGQGWEKFTDGVIQAINDNCEHVVYMLWGAKAQAKCKNVDRTRNLILETVHPSPLSASRGFFGCHHFSKANQYLQEHNKKPIDWQLPEASVIDMQGYTP